jgi:hypothetical protein
MSHRFIHLEFKENVSNIKNKIDEYINFIYEIEKKHMKFHRVSEDCDLFDEKGKLVLNANPKGYSIMIIC